MARLIEPEVPEITDDHIRAGPPTKVPFASSDDVHCRLIPRDKSGGSLKFRCMRTNARNQLFDEDGELVPQAQSVDSDGFLLDRLRRRILAEDGNARKGDELRIKYFLGAEPPERHREMFTETVVSRIFWVLGIPVDRVYLPATVSCFGCSTDPFGQTEPLESAVPRVFPLASVKRPYEGRKIDIERRRGFIGLGGTYDHGWSFNEIRQIISKSPARRLEAEVLALSLHLVGYHNLHAYQNDLRCRRGAWDKETGVCSDPVAYVSDVGGTLGGARTLVVEGQQEPKQSLHPRGDFITFTFGTLFADPNSCTLPFDFGGIRSISEGARSMLDARIRGRLEREQLRIIFEQASIHRLDKRVNDLVAERYKLRAGPELDRAVQLLWADEMHKRLNRILTVRC